MSEIPAWAGVALLAAGILVGAMRAPRGRGLHLLDDTARFRALREEGRRV